MSTPLLSVVIPTHNRPQFLSRSIDSALASGPKGEVEIIVVPNGPNESWKQVAAWYVGQTTVRWEPVTTAHANAARNHGMDLASGKYLRFLDDDDYMLSTAAEQLAAAEQKRVDICVGDIDIRDADDGFMKVRQTPAHDRFADALLAPRHNSLIHAYLYKRLAVSQYRWNTDIAFNQDKHWLYTLCRLQKWSFLRVGSAVGVWQQHAGTRISQTRHKGEHAKVWATLLLDTVRALDEQARLDDKRKALAARHLWQIICGSYHLDRTFWRARIRDASTLWPPSRPDIMLYRHALTRWIPVQAVMDAGMPVQLVRRTLRIAAMRTGLTHPIVHP